MEGSMPRPAIVEGCAGTTTVCCVASVRTPEQLRNRDADQLPGSSTTKRAFVSSKACGCCHDFSQPFASSRASRFAPIVRAALRRLRGRGPSPIRDRR